MPVKQDIAYNPHLEVIFVCIYVPACCQGDVWAQAHTWKNLDCALH